MKLKTEDLRSAFAVVNAVRATPVAESSQFVKLAQDGQTLRLALTGTLRAEAPVKCVEPGTKWIAYLDRRALEAFLATTAASEIEFFYDKKLVLRAGQRLEVAPHAPISGYETWKPGKPSPLSDAARAAIRTGVKYLPTVGGSEHMEAAFFGAKSLMFTNGLFFMSTAEASAIEFFLPAELANFLASFGGGVVAESSGVGVVFGGGYVYQPLSADLDRFPKDKIAELIADARKSAPAAITKASALASVFSVAQQFLFDQNEAAKVETAKGGLQITVEMPAGKFQRVVPASNKARVETLWPIKRILPWLEYVVSLDSEAEVSFSKQANSGALQRVGGKRAETFLFADL